MKNLLVLSLLVLSLLACKSTSNKEVTDEVAENAVEKFAENSVNIRKPGDVADLLSLSGTRFMPELVNDPMNYEIYAKDPVQAAANIGAYMMGGLYQVAFDEKYDGYMSIAAAKQLAIGLGIGDIMEEIVLERYSEGEHPNDSIINLIRAGVSRSETMLADNDQSQLFAAMLVGNYIEKLHILFTNIFEYPIDMPEQSKVIILRDILIITSNALDLLPEAISIVEKYKKDEKALLLNELKEIEKLRESSKLTEEQFSKLQAEMIFENEAFLAIYEKVKAARAIIVATE